jgi:DNA-binding MarR family transcriptional regulator
MNVPSQTFAGASIAARIQGFPDANQALLLASLEEARGHGERFGVGDITTLMDDLGLPRVHVSNALASLQRAGLVGRLPGRGRVWRVAPRGRDAVASLVTPREALQLSLELGLESGSTLGGQVHNLIPHWLAPAAIASAVRTFVEAHPIEFNIFGMTRFPRQDGDGELRDALQAASYAAKARGFDLILASERTLVDDLWGNVMAHIWASSLGLALFEARSDRGVNHNLAIESGAMLMTGRRCALLRDRTVGQMPSDLVGHIYFSVNLDDPGTVASAVDGWLTDVIASRKAGT